MHDESETRSEAQTADLVKQLRSEIENLEVALKSRDRIGQAKGVLMERLKVTEDEAFELLKHASQATHIRLAEVADHLMFCGELPSAGSR